MSVSCLCWSRDRAMQLEACLNSMWHNITGLDDVIVIYHATSDLHRQAYCELIHRQLEHKTLFIRQAPNDFRGDALHALRSMTGQYAFGQSDDNIAINPKDLTNFVLPPEYAAFSLRLHPGVNYCQPADLKIESPNNIFWKWENYDSRGCFGYPHPCDSNIYNRADWIGLLSQGDFTRPNQMEVWMDRHRPANKPWLACDTVPTLINIAANAVQDGTGNVAGSYSVDELAQRFLDGESIDWQAFQGYQANQCHVIAPLTFVKYGRESV